MTEHQTTKAGGKRLDRLVNVAVGVAAFMSTVLTVIKMLEMFHILPK